MSTLTTASPPAPFTALADTYGRGYLAIAFAARLPQAMLPLGVLLLISDRTGSFALAGSTVAAMSVGGALGGVGIGHLADRFGHRRTGLIATTLLTGLLVGLVLAAIAGLPTPAVVGLAAAVGLCNPQVGSLARSRWLQAGRERAGLVPTAMGYEAAADETSFVLGPVVVGLLAAIDPVVGLLTAAALALVAQYAFALHRSATVAPTGPVDPAAPARPRLPVAPLVPIAAVVAGVGLVFGSSQTGVAARLAAAGQDSLTGPVYACLGVGSATAAVLTGRLLRRVAPRTRILGSAAGLALTCALLTFALGPVLLALACLLVGLTVAPVLVSAYALVDGVVPAERSATAMAVLATATVAGVAVGAAGGGLLVDRFGPTPALGIGVAAGLLVLLAAIPLPRHPGFGFGERV